MYDVGLVQYLFIKLIKHLAAVLEKKKTVELYINTYFNSIW